MDSQLKIPSVRLISLTIILIILIVICFYNFLTCQVAIPTSNNQLQFNVVLLLTVFFGGFGGILQSFRDITKNLEICRYNLDLSDFCKKGFYIFNGFLIGIGGALAVNFLFLWINKIEYANDIKNVMFLAGLNTVAGFLGNKALQAVAGKLEKQISDVEKRSIMIETESIRSTNLAYALTAATSSLALKHDMPADLQDALNTLLSFKDEIISDRRVVILCGRIYRRLKQYENAIAVLTAYVDNKNNKIDDNYADILYNRSCYGVLLFSELEKKDRLLAEKTLKEGVSDLRESIKIRPLNKEDAKNDPDFDAIRNKEEFKEIIK